MTKTAPRSLGSALGLLLTMVLLFSLPGPSLAETSHPAGASPIGEGDATAPIARPAGMRGAGGPATHAPGPLERVTTWILHTQRQLHRKLTEGLHALRDGATAHAAGSLILISLFYGVFHAAGPGHGKAVISTYLLTQPQNLRRGILLSTVSALAQGITAILLVGVLIGIFGWLARDALGQVRTLEIASFALVALLGLWLMLRAIRHAWRLHRANAPRLPARVHSHRDDTPLSAPRHLRLHASADHAHGHPQHAGHVHAENCGCGTPHHVDPNHGGTWWGTVLAVGIRPCSGGVLIMAVSTALGMAWAGMAAVLAMSLGTAVTVSALATLAVSARDWTRHWMQPTRLGHLTYVAPALGLAGGGIIALIGFSLVLGAIAYQPVAHPLGIR